MEEEEDPQGFDFDAKARHPEIGGTSSASSASVKNYWFSQINKY